MRAARVDVVVVGALASVLVAARLLGPGPYEAVVTEDGPYEWAQFAAYTAAAVGFARAARRARGLLPAVAAVGFVVVAGEEVAWGQRLFDLRVDVVQRVNDQGELTVHNIGGALDASWAAFAALAVWGTVGHRVAAALPALAPVAPHRDLRWLFAPAALYAASRLLLDAPGYAYAKASELFELCVALGYAAVALAPRVPGRRVSVPAAPAPSAAGAGDARRSAAPSVAALGPEGRGPTVG